jgi:hypothetical protein
MGGKLGKIVRKMVTTDNMSWKKGTSWEYE